MCSLALGDDEYLRLFSIAVRIGLSESLNWQQAEDIAQDILVALWLRVRSKELPPVRDRTKWVVMSARYATMRAITIGRREVPLLVASPDPDMNWVDGSSDLMSCLGELSDRDRKLANLRYEHHLPIQMIASQLGVSERTVRRRLGRLRTMLSRTLRAQ